MTRPVSRWTIFAAVFGGGIVLDQWTKFLAVGHLTDLFRRVGAQGFGQKVAAFLLNDHLEPFSTDPYYVIRPLWRMIYVENPNAAFGLGHFLGPNARLAVFLVAAIAAAVAVVHFFRKLPENERFLQVALALVLAGDLGNFIDRVIRRYVIDFIDWYWWNRPDLRWPTFNLADSMLVIGVAMLLLKPFPSKGEPAVGGKP
jgi:signal peptidase II